MVTVKQAQKRKKVVNRRALMIGQVTYGIRLIKNEAVSFSFGTSGSNIVIDNCESVVEVMISVIGDDLI
jgi:hypothetical protein